MLLSLSFRSLVVGGLHVCDSIESPIVSALRSREELDPDSKCKVVLVYRRALYLVSRQFKVNTIPFVDAVHRLHKWNRLFPTPGAVFPPRR